MGQRRETIMETIIGTNILQLWKHYLYLLCIIVIYQIVIRELVMLGF